MMTSDLCTELISNHRRFYGHTCSFATCRPLRLIGEPDYRSGSPFVHFLRGSSAGFTGSAGFNGIVAALFGQLHPLGAIPASIFFGGLIVGANAMQRAVQIPSAMITALNGLLVIFVVSSDIWRRRMVQRQQKAEAAEALAGAEQAVPI